MHDVGFGADVIIPFVGHNAHIGVICGLYEKKSEVDNQ